MNNSFYSFFHVLSAILDYQEYVHHVTSGITKHFIIDKQWPKRTRNSFKSCIESKQLLLTLLGAIFKTESISFALLCDMKV